MWKVNYLFLLGKQKQVFNFLKISTKEKKIWLHLDVASLSGRNIEILVLNRRFTVDDFHALWIYSVVLITLRLAAGSGELAGVTFDLGTSEERLACASDPFYLFLLWLIYHISAGAQHMSTCSLLNLLCLSKLTSSGAESVTPSKYMFIFLCFGRCSSASHFFLWTGLWNGFFKEQVFQWF